MPEFLKKNIAGIPLYVWTLLVLAAIGLGLVLRSRTRSRTSMSAYEQETAFDYSAAEAQPIPGTAGGGAGGAGVGAIESDGSVLGAIGELGQTVREQGLVLAGAIAAQEPSTA